MKKTISLLLALVCAVTALVGCDKQQNETEATNDTVETVNATEATEPPTEITAPSTEATEPSTQATEPTTQATEPTTQATEPPTAPPAEYNYVMLDTMPDGEDVEFNIGFSKGTAVPTHADPMELFITNSSGIGTCIIAANTIKEFQDIVGMLKYDSFSTDYYVEYQLRNMPEIAKYNETFFKDKSVIVRFYANDDVKIEKIVKNGTDLCIYQCYYKKIIRNGIPITENPSPKDGFWVTIVEVDKSDLSGVSTICSVRDNIEINVD